MLDRARLPARIRPRAGRLLARRLAPPGGPRDGRSASPVVPTRARAQASGARESGRGRGRAIGAPRCEADEAVARRFVPARSTDDRASSSSPMTCRARGGRPASKLVGVESSPDPFATLGGYFFADADGDLAQRAAVGGDGRSSCGESGAMAQQAMYQQMVFPTRFVWAYGGKQARALPHRPPPYRRARSHAPAPGLEQITATPGRRAVRAR